MRTEPMWVLALGAALAGAMIIAAAWARHGLLAAYPEPVGVDGYWYAVQLRSLLTDGHTAYPSLPAALWFLVPFAAAGGPVAGLKLGAAIGVSLQVLSGFALARTLARSTAAGVVAAAVVATSPASIYLTTEFVKQGIALSLLAGFLAALAAAHERPGRGRIALAAAVGAAAALAHKLAFALALAGLAAVALARGRRWLLLVGGVAAAFLAATSAIWIGGLSAAPDLALPALRFSSGAALWFGHECWAAAVVALALVGLEAAERRRGRSGPLDRAPIAWLLVGLALVAALPWLAVDDPDGLGFRLRLTAHLALAPLAGMLAVHLVRRPLAQLAVAGAVALALLVVRPLASDEGVVRPNPALVDATRRATAALPAGAEVVTPDRQVAFLVTWVSSRPARTRPAAGALGGATWRLLPDAWLDRASRAALADLAPGQARLVLIPEATYQAMRARLPAAARARWDEWDRTGALPRPAPSRYHGFFDEEPP